MSKLLPNEKLSFEQPRAERLVANDAILNERYAAGAVRIVTEQARYPLPQVPRMVSSPDYRLDPEFQRRHRWGPIQKSRLIESFIINVPVPPIFLYEVGYAKYEVMDGLQRLTAIDDFYNDRLALEGLEEWPDLNGRTYSSLPNAVRRGVDRRYLSSIVLLQETAKNPIEAQRLKQLVFERLNSGGVQLSNQEARNAIYDGPMNQLTLRLSRTPEFCRLWSIPEPDSNELERGVHSRKTLNSKLYRKMIDVEHVLRFFAYRQRLENYDPDLKSFLDNYLERANELPIEVLDGLEEVFVRTVRLAHEVMGETAFHLRRKRGAKWIWPKRPTLAVYDPLMFALSQQLEHSHLLLERKEKIRAEIGFIYEIHADEWKGRYTNRDNLLTRNKLFSEFFASYV